MTYSLEEMRASIVIRAFLDQSHPWSSKNYNIPGNNGEITMYGIKISMHTVTHIRPYDHSAIKITDHHNGSLICLAKDKKWTLPQLPILIDWQWPSEKLTEKDPETTSKPSRQECWDQLAMDKSGNIDAAYELFLASRLQRLEQKTTFQILPSGKVLHISK